MPSRSDRSSRFHLIRAELDDAMERSLDAEGAAACGDTARAQQLRFEARESLDCALEILNGVEGICEVHLRPVRTKLADAMRRLGQEG